MAGKRILAECERMIQEKMWMALIEKCENCAPDSPPRTDQNPRPICVGECLNTGKPCALYYVKPSTSPKQMFRAIRSECYFCLNGNRPEYCRVEAACALYPYLLTKKYADLFLDGAIDRVA
ncbi:hypothetical protein Desti_5111 [Desulfomonile tiedjei DSM 6799]|uniref:Uncharacterized protein n=1 Tax=Desulfomonile tiedjei (strain ATCC 49306 / DSM 6799 / DCB-1) TaxID=706587 RepID=I4CDS8_DESTA|nr:hypothetical protein Desti_5111 [Desulfomonile tiedjei DSM 6799]